MTDEEWEAYHRAMASYQRQIETTERAAGATAGSLVRARLAATPTHLPGPDLPNHAAPGRPPGIATSCAGGSATGAGQRLSARPKSSSPPTWASIREPWRLLPRYDPPWTELLRLTCP